MRGLSFPVSVKSLKKTSGSQGTIYCGMLIPPFLKCSNPLLKGIQ